MREFVPCSGAVQHNMPPRPRPIRVRLSFVPRTPVQTIEIKLTGEYVELCQLLKLAGIASSGGQGKHIVAAGEVRVDGQPEIRKTAKIRAGQRVECRGITIAVAAP